MEPPASKARLSRRSAERFASIITVAMSIRRPSVSEQGSNTEGELELATSALSEVRSYSVVSLPPSEVFLFTCRSFVPSTVEECGVRPATRESCTFPILF